MENTILASIVPRHLQHSAFGIKYILYFGVGSVSVKLMSWMQSVWGMGSSFVGLGIISILLVLTLIAFLVYQKHAG